MKLKLILLFFWLTLLYGQQLPSLSSNLPLLNNFDSANLPYLEIHPSCQAPGYTELIRQRERSLLIEWYHQQPEPALRAKPNISYHGPIPQNFIALFLAGIAQGVETSNHSNPYNAQNSYSSAHGKYQITNALWQHYSYLYCDSIGISRHTLKHTPVNQELLAKIIARNMYRRHKQPNRSNEQIARWMAKEWYGGMGGLKDDWDNIPHPEAGNRLSYRQYANKVIKKMRQFNPNLIFKKNKTKLITHRRNKK